MKIKKSPRAFDERRVNKLVQEAVANALTGQSGSGSQSPGSSNHRHLEEEARRLGREIGQRTAGYLDRNTKWDQDERYRDRSRDNRYRDQRDRREDSLERERPNYNRYRDRDRRDDGRERSRYRRD